MDQPSLKKPKFVKSHVDEKVELIVTITDYTANGFLYVPDRPIQGIERIELVQTFVAGVPNTLGVPTYDFYDLTISDFSFNSVMNSGATNRLRLYNVGERTRTDLNSRTVLHSRNDMGTTLSNTLIRAFRPDGTPCAAGDFDTLSIDLRITFVEGSRL